MSGKSSINDNDPLPYIVTLRANFNEIVLKVVASRCKRERQRFRTHNPVISRLNVASSSPRGRRVSLDRRWIDRGEPRHHNAPLIRFRVTPVVPNWIGRCREIFA